MALSSGNNIQLLAHLKLIYDYTVSCLLDLHQKQWKNQKYKTPNPFLGFALTTFISVGDFCTLILFIEELHVF